MTESIEPTQAIAVIPEQKHDVAVFKSLTSGGKFITRIQFMSPKSDKCQAGEFPSNHYALVRSKDDLVDIGAQVDCIPVSWRPKALETQGNDTLIVYDHESSDFKRIFNAAQQQQSKGYMCGPEFLLWVPSIDQFVLFFCGNKSTRREAPVIMDYLGKSATLKWRSAENKKGKWNTPSIQACSAPLSLPDEESYKEILDQFNNPPKEQVETVEDTPEGDRVR